MSPSNDRRVREAERRAAEWFLRVHEDANPTAEDFIGYVKWLEAAPEHEAVIARLELVWELSAALEDDPKFNLDAREPLPVPVCRRSTARRRWYTGFAIAAVTAIGVSFWNLLPGGDDQRQWIESYQTAIGEQRVVHLPDGSQIILNTASEVHVEFLADARNVLLSRGEAFFAVARDRVRPFAVYAGAGEVRALGTRFNVQLKDEGVIVALLEGEIEVTARSPDPGERKRLVQRLESGEQTRYTADGVLGTIERIEAGRVAQWRDRKLSFSDMPLREIVEEVNRYTPVKLVIQDPALAEQRLSAYFRVDNVNSFLVAIEQFFGIQSRRRAGEILLSGEQ